jgi:hypothetical protein
MEEQSSEEFDGVKRHCALSIAPLIVFPSKRDLSIGAGEQPPIRDGHAMRIPGQILEHLVRPCERGLGIDNPLRLLQSREELAPGHRGTPSLALPLHAQALLDGCLPQRRQESASKKPAQDADWQEEAFGTGDPGRAIEGETTSGSQAMDVRMVVQSLPPGMQNAQKADVSA